MPLCCASNIRKGKEDRTVVLSSVLLGVRLLFKDQRTFDVSKYHIFQAVSGITGGAEEQMGNNRVGRGIIVDRLVGSIPLVGCHIAGFSGDLFVPLGIRRANVDLLFFQIRGKFADVS